MNTVLKYFFLLFGLLNASQLFCIDFSNINFRYVFNYILREEKVEQCSKSVFGNANSIRQYVKYYRYGEGALKITNGVFNIPEWRNVSSPLWETFISGVVGIGGYYLTVLPLQEPTISTLLLFRMNRDIQHRYDQYVSGINKVGKIALSEYPDAKIVLRNCFDGIATCTGIGAMAYFSMSSERSLAYFLGSALFTAERGLKLYERNWKLRPPSRHRKKKTSEKNTGKSVVKDHN